MQCSAAPALGARPTARRAPVRCADQPRCTSTALRRGLAHARQHQARGLAPHALSSGAIRAGSPGGLEDGGAANPQLTSFRGEGHPRSPELPASGPSVNLPDLCSAAFWGAGLPSRGVCLVALFAVVHVSPGAGCASTRRGTEAACGGAGRQAVITYAKPSSRPSREPGHDAALDAALRHVRRHARCSQARCWAPRALRSESAEGFVGLLRSHHW